MIEWIKNNKITLIRNSFLLPILLVVIMSISHVVSWYDIGNPLSWAIYLSVAIEIFALASVSAASIKISKGSIWFLFIMVTLIQIIGNVFYEFKEISLNESGFLSWVELVSPWFEDWELLDHRRLLALIQGGTLPIMSLTSLHFYIQFNENIQDKDNLIDEESNLSKTEESEPDETTDLASGSNLHAEVTEKVSSKKQYEDTLFETSNVSDPNRYINKTDHDLKVSKGTHKKSDERPQKNWGK
jgi:hypothetical protein